MAKHVLNTGDDELDFLLFGIVCQENQYTVLSLLNDALSIDLQLSDYIPFQLKGKLFRFSLYNFKDEERALEFFFIPNLSNFEGPLDPELVKGGLFAGVEVEEKTRLVKELSKTDYFLMLKGEQAHSARHNISGALRAVAGFASVQSIEPKGLASRKNLIF